MLVTKALAACAALVITSLPAAAASPDTAGPVRQHPVAVDARDGADDHIPAADLAAFHRLHQRQKDAWARKDGTAYASTYTSDADLITFFGSRLHTRDGIATGMQYYFDNYIDTTRFIQFSEDIDYVSRDTVLIIRTDCQAAGETEDCVPGTESINSNVLVREHGRWLQRSFQNTRIQNLSEGDTSQPG
jgi:uncharacterized protein (TIGR02246 family)